VKITGLDGKTHKLKLTGREADPNRSASSGHRRARALLLAQFPYDRVYEEVHLPGAKWDLRVDLIIPSRMLAVEIQGAQHRTYNAFFHGTAHAFREQLRRDAAKRQLLEFNGFRVVSIDDDTPHELWPALIRGEGDGGAGGLGGEDGVAAGPPPA
jgi:hypothetical protein